MAACGQVPVGHLPSRMEESWASKMLACMQRAECPKAARQMSGRGMRLFGTWMRSFDVWLRRMVAHPMGGCEEGGCGERAPHRRASCARASCERAGCARLEWKRASSCRPGLADLECAASLLRPADFVTV